MYLLIIALVMSKQVFLVYILQLFTMAAESYELSDVGMSIKIKESLLNSKKDT